MFHSTYKGTKSCLGGLDDTVRLGKEIYGIIQPVISDITGNDLSGASRHVRRGLTGYDTMKEVITGHGQVEDA
eukprot:10926122-Prorocentrum_lima.AAC.1